MDEKQFEQDYRNWKRQAAPDLWDRIDGKLKNYPEREPGCAVKADGKSGMKNFSGRRWIYPLAAGFAAMLCLAMAVPGLYQKRSVLSRGEAGFGEETSAAQFQETTAAAQLQETMAAAGSDVMAAGEGEIMAAGGGEAITAEESEGDAWDRDAVLTMARLTVPEDALVASFDSAYFSQAILSDTELLCTGTVEDASLEYDSQGRAVRVAYQLSLKQIHFAQDYLTKTDQITVKSPIVKAEGDEAWLLYQMEPQKTYLLPLKKQEGNWELLYPFAPQIQLTDTQGWLFHSGYSSLINEDTQVVAGEKEGENDYYYDRMLLREDDRFLSDFLELIQKP